MQDAHPPAQAAAGEQTGPARALTGALRPRHGLPTTGDGIYFFAPARVHKDEDETALHHALSWLEPLVLPGVCVALTPRRPGCSAMLDVLAGLLARTRVDARAWITPGAALSPAARPLVRSARVLVLDEGGAGGVDRLTACRALLLEFGAGEVALLALARPG